MSLFVIFPNISHLNLSIMSCKVSLSIPLRFDRYQTIKEIGGGGFSAVVLAKDIKTEELYACKLIERAKMVEQGHMQQLEQELRLLEQINHPLIAKLHKVVYTEKYVIVVMEYCENGSLFDSVINFGPVVEWEVKNYIVDVLEALYYLHSKGISHRDIKLDNIVISRDYHAKLVDFGFSCRGDIRSTICGTLEYTPPEILTGTEYDPKKGDIWALGVCIYTLLTAQYPWKGSDPEITKQILSAQYTIPQTVSTFFADIIKSTLQLNPNDRPNVEELLAKFKVKKSKLPQLSFSPEKKQIKNHQTRVLSWKPVGYNRITPQAKKIYISANKTQLFI